MNTILNTAKKYRIAIAVVMSALFIALLVILIQGATKATSTNDPMKNQVVEKISFENANLEYQDGISTFSVNLYNDRGEDVNLKNISIVITDNENNKYTLIGYIGETLLKDEGKIMQASIDQQINDVKSITYTINY